MFFHTFDTFSDGKWALIQSLWGASDNIIKENHAKRLLQIADGGVRSLSTLWAAGPAEQVWWSGLAAYTVLGPTLNPATVPLQLETMYLKFSCMQCRTVLMVCFRRIRTQQTQCISNHSNTMFCKYYTHWRVSTSLSNALGSVIYGGPLVKPVQCCHRALDVSAKPNTTLGNKWTSHSRLFSACINSLIVYGEK